MSSDKSILGRNKMKFDSSDLNFRVFVVECNEQNNPVTKEKIEAKSNHPQSGVLVSDSSDLDLPCISFFRQFKCTFHMFLTQPLCKFIPHLFSLRNPAAIFVQLLVRLTCLILEVGCRNICIDFTFLVKPRAGISTVCNRPGPVLV